MVPIRARAAAILTIAASLLFLGGASVARAFDTSAEEKNFSKTSERATIYSTPEYQALLRQVSLQNRAAATTMQVADPERNFTGHLCATGEDGCAGDARLYDWESKGHGIVRKVLFTARNGATISGHVWATRTGPAQRPGIVITNGSIQAPEQLYWFIAQTLAKAGYVVLTSDPQGQGQSDELGESPDENEGSPAQSDGRPFFDGTEDALNFFLSSPQHPYEPVPSCESGTSHAAKQDRRVAAGLNAAYNPLHEMLDAGRIGLAGHSFGAAGVSFEGQKDPRVSAIVALDNLGSPSTTGGLPVMPCPSDPASHDPAPITKPALGMSADYGLTPQPNTSDPDPLAKSEESLAYTDAGADTGEIIIRGGTHYEFSFIPNPGFGGTLRGADLVAWYTTAWFDKYVKGDPAADERLLTGRWRSDPREAAIDPDGDGNLFSWYYRSRIDIHLAGGSRVKCGSLRDLQNTEPGDNCTSAAVGDDGRPGDYSYFAEARQPDGDAYERPASATPIRASLVPAYRQCGTGANPGNGEHAAPLSTGSCTPPHPLGAAHFGVRAVGTASLEVVPGDLATLADEADMSITAEVTDVRAGDANGSDYNPSAVGADMTLAERVRITDYASGPSQAEAGTATDLDFTVPVDCADTADTSLGATCSVTTSADSVVPGSISEARRTAVQVFRLRLEDSGPNGTRGDADDALFAQQGIYAP
jgi:dienelactone hydrolase